MLKKEVHSNYLTETKFKPMRHNFQHLPATSPSSLSSKPQQFNLNFPLGMSVCVCVSLFISHVCFCPVLSRRLVQFIINRMIKLLLQTLTDLKKKSI